MLALGCGGVVVTRIIDMGGKRAGILDLGGELISCTLDSRFSKVCVVCVFVQGAPLSRDPRSLFCQETSGIWSLTSF